MDEDHKNIILEALDSEDVLSDWEWDFVNSLADRNDGGPLSELQIEKLNVIGDKL